MRPGPWQSFEPFIRHNLRCHCHKREREAAGHYQPPILDLYTRCTLCGQHPKHNRDDDLEARFICPRCRVAWNDLGTGWWLDDYGNLGEPVTTPQLLGERL